MTTDKTTGGAKQPPDPECFEEWLYVRLQEQPDRKDEVGQVACWVLERMKPGYPSRWIPEPILLWRHGHAYDVPARYENYLRHVANQPEESIKKFFRVHDLYLNDESAAYDRMVEKVGRRLDHKFGGGGNGDGEAPRTVGDEPDGDPEEDYSWESWNRFFYELHGPEVLGYELDEDGYPIDGDPDGGVEGG